MNGDIMRTAEPSELEYLIDMFIKNCLPEDMKDVSELDKTTIKDLRNILYCRGYHKTENNELLRLNKDNTVEIFGEYDITQTKAEQLKPGYFYAKLENPQTADQFLYYHLLSKESKESTVTHACGIGAMMAFAGMLLGAYLVSSHYSYISELLICGSVTGGGIGSGTTGLILSRKNKKIEKKREGVLDTYSENLVHGKDAVLAALGRYE